MSSLSQSVCISLMEDKTFTTAQRIIDFYEFTITKRVNYSSSDTIIKISQALFSQESKNLLLFLRLFYLCQTLLKVQYNYSTYAV